MEPTVNNVISPGSDTGTAVPPGPGRIVRQKPAKTLTAAICGTVVEYYDFGIYGYMATMLGALFFVSSDPNAELLGTFATFAVAFFLRLPGGVFFGHMGDRYGRKRALSWTILLMVLSTALIGILPTHVTLGIWATVLLVLTRSLQGFAAGGELSGANAFVAESAPAHRRATFTSMVNTGTYLGSILASLVALAVNSWFSAETITDWAWRLPFLLSLPIGVVGLWIRSRLEDTPEFQRTQHNGETADLPIKELFRTSGTTIVKIACLGAVITGGYYLSSVYAATYLQTVGGHSPRTAFLSTSLALVVGCLCMPISGMLSDRFGRKPVLAIGSAASGVAAYPMFALMAQEAVWPAITAQCVLMALVSLVNGSAFTTFAEMLKTSVRYSGIAFGNNISNSLLGGTAPFIATWLITVSDNNLSPTFYFIFCAAVSTVAALTLRETKGIDLHHD
ncbi:MFS transporter [Streptomyces chartreusis]